MPDSRPHRWRLTLGRCMVGVAAAAVVCRWPVLLIYAAPLVSVLIPAALGLTITLG